MTPTDDKNILENEAILDDILEVSVGEEAESSQPQAETEAKDTDALANSEVDVADYNDTDIEEDNDTNASQENKANVAPAPLDKSTKMRRLLRNMLRDDENETGSLKDMFNDIQISGEWLKRHWSFLLIVFICMLLFVTNRYQAQQEIIEEARLRRELNDWKYVWLTQFSELTRSSRQSNIEESLKQRGDSTLKLSKEAPFIIKVK